MKNAFIGFVAGWCCALFFAAVSFVNVIDQAYGKTFSCQSGDSFWTRKKWACTETEFKAQQAGEAQR